MAQGLDLWVAGSFVAFLLVFVGIGAWSATRATNSETDYLLAGRSVSPWLAALSAVASNNSGFMFIGLIGATYTAGISAMWLMVGWVLGDWLTWYFVHERLRRSTERFNAHTIPTFLAQGRDGALSRPVALVAGLIVVIFLGTYSAAQLSAGSKALQALFGWPHATGAIIGAVIIVVYCYAGGIRASIWTDAAQSMVMIGSMILLLVTAVVHTGGWSNLWARLDAIDPKLTTFMPQDLKLGFGLYLVGWFVAGVGAIGQPHIMVRAMTIRSPADMPTARRIYNLWNALFAAICILVGVACRALLDGGHAASSFDEELALPLLSLQLLPAIFVGLVLAGLFSATMSTADSQVLSCAASLTQDVLPRSKHAYAIGKMGTIVVTVAALLIALYGTDNVFQLVTLSWSALASGLGPLLLLRVLGRPVHPATAIGMMLTGIAAVIGWRYGLQLSSAVYDVLPGMVSGTLAYFVLQPLFGSRSHFAS